jgi:multicomponent Na+:H+ antiporter subunit D
VTVVPHDWLPPLAIVLPILGACLLLPIAKLVPRAIADSVAATVVALHLVVTGLLVHATAGGRVVSWSGGWHPDGGRTVGIALVADGTGAALAALAGTLTLAALVFGWRYFEETQAHYRALVLLFLAGMTGYALTGDLFNMFVFFELMGAVAYALTGFHIEEPESVQAGFAFGVVNSIGGYLALVGVGLLYARTGQLGLAQLGASLSGLDALVLAAFTLIATGWLIKAAAVPFHFWLADAHAVAPAPVCVLFSGIMAPLGVYGAGRLYWVVFAGVLPADAAGRVMAVLGVLTAVVGALMAFSQRHLKRMLAYSTIAHIGLFLIGLSTMDTSGTAGSGLYLFGHAGAKAALFLLTGVLLSRYRSVDEADLHGAATGSRLLGALFLTGGLALAGLPPFGTAMGKALIEETGPGTAALVLAVSVVTGAAVLRAGLRIFYGVGPAPREEDEDTELTTGREEEPDTERRLNRVPATMTAAALGLLAVSLAVGVVPGVARYAGTAASSFTDHAGYVATVLHSATAPVAGHADPQWTVSGVLLGLVSAAGATGLALASARRPDVVRRVMGGLDPAMRWLHRLHSGQVGDYVAWLPVGSVVIAGLLLA